MPSFKIDTNSAVVFVAVPPTQKLVNRQTGEIAVDRETGAQMMTVGLMVTDEGQAEVYNVSVPETGVPEGLTPGTPVAVNQSPSPYVGERVQRPEAARDRLPRRGRYLTRRRRTEPGGLNMTAALITSLIAGGLALLLRWRRPAWYWLGIGVFIAGFRVLFRYGSVMEACGLTVPPSRMRLALARATRTEAPSSRVPHILRMWPTRTGLVLRIKLRPGQDAYDFIASTDRLRHSFTMQGRRHNTAPYWRQRRW